jgi:hypothetical protein
LAWLARTRRQHTTLLLYMCPHYVLILLRTLHYYYICVLIMSSYYCYVCVILLLYIHSACTNSASAHYTTTIYVSSLCPHTTAHTTLLLYVSSLYPHTAAICVLRVHERGRPPRPNLLYLCPSRARTRAAICVLRVHELGRPPRPNLNILCTVTKPHMRSQLHP